MWFCFQTSEGEGWAVRVLPEGHGGVETTQLEEEEEGGEEGEDGLMISTEAGEAVNGAEEEEEGTIPPTIHNMVSVLSGR